MTMLCEWTVVAAVDYGDHGTKRSNWIKIGSSSIIIDIKERVLQILTQLLYYAYGYRVFPRG